MRADELRGHLDAVLLSVIGDEPAHGYAILDALRTRSGGALDLPTGTVYPALHRLERAELISSTWSIVDGRRRRTYRLTARGKKMLSDERTHWQEFVSTVSMLLDSAPGGA